MQTVLAPVLKYIKPETPSEANPFIPMLLTVNRVVERMASTTQLTFLGYCEVLTSVNGSSIVKNG